MKNKIKMYYVIKGMLVLALISVGIKSFLNQNIAASSVVSIALGILGLKNYELKLLKSEKN